MKTLHSGTSDFPHVRTDTIAYKWKFEEAADHEHPYILTVTVAEHIHSEGYDHDVGNTEAAAKADKLAREIYATTQAKT
jgi:dsRNA-specific ribonuclease